MDKAYLSIMLIDLASCQILENISCRPRFAQVSFIWLSQLPEYLGCKTWVFQVRASKGQSAEFSQTNLAIYLLELYKCHDDAATAGIWHRVTNSRRRKQSLFCLYDCLITYLMNSNVCLLRSWSKSSHPTANVLAWLAVYCDEERHNETAKQNKTKLLCQIS